MPATFDLKQVGKLFNDTIAAIRDDTPDLDALEPQAIEWLKAARYQLMRDIEQQYYSLERTRDTPTSQPAWAVDPTQKLYLDTKALPPVLSPFRTTITHNLTGLLTACGFQATGFGFYGSPYISIQISFPAQLAATGAQPQAQRTLHIDDEFSCAGGKGGKRKRIGSGPFTAGNFARLMIENNDAAASGNSEKSDSGSSAKRRRGSRVVKIEEDDEGDRDDDDSRSKGSRRRGSRLVKQEEESDNEETNGRRLRSTTRASSTATLKSASEPRNTRRSTRVKKQEEE
ncbi:hypothetical protein R3P38DRAFT_3048694 [Favolaschia claudopus]|uniref:Uncharacterized protein n=1 Tax=Favolaschia claudopus TaxID=2862362 RepID=A0AAW0A5K8_9AGAR